jgi:hypothetical protein
MFIWELSIEAYKVLFLTKSGIFVDQIIINIGISESFCQLLYPIQEII